MTFHDVIVGTGCLIFQSISDSMWGYLIAGAIILYAVSPAPLQTKSSDPVDSWTPPELPYADFIANQAKDEAAFDAKDSKCTVNTDKKDSGEVDYICNEKVKAFTADYLPDGTFLVTGYK